MAKVLASGDRPWWRDMKIVSLARLSHLLLSVPVRYTEEETGARMLRSFADWLSNTALGNAFLNHQWVVPTSRSIHILAVSVCGRFIGYTWSFYA